MLATNKTVPTMVPTRAGVLKCREDADPGLGKAVRVEDGEPKLVVVGMTVGPRMAVARELSGPKPSCAIARHVLPVVFFNDLAGLSRIER